MHVTRRICIIMTEGFIFIFYLYSIPGAYKFYGLPVPGCPVSSQEFEVRLVFCVVLLKTAKFNFDPPCVFHSQGTFIFSIIKYSPLKFSHSYVYPLWANILGWFMATVSLSLIPLFVLYKIMQGEGTLRQVSRSSGYSSSLG